MHCSKFSPGRYLDQLAKKIYTVDHIKGEITAVEEHNPELVESVE